MFKGEDPTEFVNYRPVSDLPVHSQVFERVLRSRSVTSLDANWVVIPGQYGIRVGHSATTLDMVEKLRGAWWRGKAALGVFIVLKKAFDTDDHRAKTCDFVFESPTGSRPRPYQVSTKIDPTQVFGEGAAECGVPQGSNLVPIFSRRMLARYKASVCTVRDCYLCGGRGQRGRGEVRVGASGGGMCMMFPFPFVDVFFYTTSYGRILTTPMSP